jgi:hypothetical protein
VDLNGGKLSCKRVLELKHIQINSTTIFGNKRIKVGCWLLMEIVMQTKS